MFIFKTSKFLLVPLSSIVLSSCAHIIEKDNTPKIAFAIGDIESIEMRVLKPNERSRKLRNGDWVITNACGHSITKFEILESTAGVKKHVIDESRIGEWCRPPYDFKIGAYFLVVDVNHQTIYDAVPLGSSNALLLDVETAEDWKTEYGDFPVELNWVEFDEPEEPDFEMSAYDPDIIRYVNEHDYVQIKTGKNGYRYVVYTHGYKLSEIFSTAEPAHAE